MFRVRGEVRELFRFLGFRGFSGSGFRSFLRVQGLGFLEGSGLRVRGYKVPGV